MKRKRRKTAVFKPTRSFINEAVQEYLSNGGTIKKLVPEENPEGNGRQASNEKKRNPFNSFGSI